MGQEGGVSGWSGMSKGGMGRLYRWGKLCLSIIQPLLPASLLLILSASIPTSKDITCGKLAGSMGNQIEFILVAGFPVDLWEVDREHCK